MKPKIYTIHPKHRKIFVLGSLLITLTITTFLALYFVASRSKLNISDVAGKINLVEAETNLATIESDLGFSVQYNKESFVSEGSISNGDGSFDAVTGDDLSKPQSYSVVTIYRNSKPQISKTNASESSALDLSHFAITTYARKDFVKKAQEKYGPKSNLELVEAWGMPKDNNTYGYKKVASEKINIGDTEYLKVTYRVVVKDQQYLTYLKNDSDEVHYYSLQNERPYHVEVQDYSSNSSEMNSDFMAIMSSIKYQSLSSKAKLYSANDNLDLGINSTYPSSNTIDKLAEIVIPSAKATTVASTDDISSAKVAGTNIPATVKIYNTHCAKLIINKMSTLTGCRAGIGSGFLISKDGYIGTNGHVVHSTVRSIILTLLQQGNVDTIAALLLAMKPSIGSSGASSMAQAIAQDKRMLGLLIEKVIELDDKFFVVENETKELIVQLSDQPPQFDKVSFKFVTGDSHKKATFVSKDYEPTDLYSDSFTASDVALIKIDIENAPVTKLGDIGSLAQGSPLVVVGYPGVAENGLVDNTKVKPTATRGVVSAIKKTTGIGKKLIQTDASISHGNSGGPAFDQHGEVIGLATYSVKDNTGASGSFNYLRDVTDLQELIDKSSITLDTSSQTSQQWEAGMDLFINRHYKKAINKFNIAKSSYPSLYLADEYIALANDRIAKGEEAFDATGLVVILLPIMVIGIGMIILAIILHKKHKKALGYSPATPTDSVQQPTVPTLPNSAVSPANPVGPDPVSTAPNQVIGRTIPQQPLPPNPTSSAQPIVVQQPVPPAYPTNPSNQANQPAPNEYPPQNPPQYSSSNNQDYPPTPPPPQNPPMV